MQRKIYRLDKVPTVAEYVRGLTGIRDNLHPNQTRLLQVHYSAPGKRSTATELAKSADILGGHPVVNAHYGRLGHMYCDYTGFTPDIRPDSTFRWWAIWMQGWQTTSGFIWELLPEVTEALELLGWVGNETDTSIDQEWVGPFYAEGSVRRITVNAYERNTAARKKCIEHHGAKCVICGFDFSEVYGELADGFIHVHHLRPLSEICESYCVDPKEDLRPVCANCHAVIHLGGSCRSIQEMKQLLAK